jgi:hypothetical protein
MACLWCQRPFDLHSKEELIICIDWLHKQFSIVCDNHTKLWKKHNL